MKSHSSLSSRRVATWVVGSLAFAWLVAACGNNGGSGDGVYDDSIPPGGATSAGAKNGGKSGSASSNGGALNAGAAGSGIGGAAGSSGSGGNAGVGGTSGAGGSSGSGAVTGGSGAPAGGASGGLGQGGGSAGGGTAGGGNVLCGNGVIDSGETCDSGMPSSSNGGTSGGGASTAGNGGDLALAGAPSVTPKYGQLCSNTCYKVSTQACLDCAFDGMDCYPFADNCLGVAAPFDAAQQTACYSVMRCIQQSNCFDGTNTLGKCYCGSLSTQACGAAPFTGMGSPDGACVNEIKAGFPTLKTNSAVLGSLTASDLPSGAAMQRLSCQKGANSSACLAACGFTQGGPAFP